MILEVTIPDIKKIEKRLKGLEGDAPAVMRKAINSTVRHVQSQISKETKKHYIVKAADVKKTLTVQKAGKIRLSGAVISRSNQKIPLYRFFVAPNTPSPLNPPEFYKSQVKKVAGLKTLYGSRDRSKAFVAEMKSGHVGIFQRQLRKRRKNSFKEPIAELYGPAVPSVIRALEVSKPILDDARQYLKEQIDKEIKRVMAL